MHAMGNHRRNIQTALNHYRHLVLGLIHLTTIDTFQSEHIKDLFVSLSSCFSGELVTDLLALSEINYGLSFGFVFFVGIIGMLLGMIIIGQIVIKILEYRLQRTMNNLV